ncbi:Sec-independent protein translocase subunit TatA [Nesterenkonia haasae]|uniref:Sec-independent protein translocase subunit TatA n=1 Tax=Nesterenkonia haasae TaxID=2587813 RepID=UPI001291DCE7|nr:Sec-independent protein translocase subunit TatA [Nesterenkonia haasae]NDK30398.1 twin-arginine translocase TatA/TatE family subunit [Nesterenkonia haasae]
MNIAGWQWLILLLILLLLFGATKLPRLARSLGESARIFKSEVKTMQDSDQPNDSRESERNAVEGDVIDPTADVHKSRERRDFS